MISIAKIENGKMEKRNGTERKRMLNGKNVEFVRTGQMRFLALGLMTGGAALTVGLIE